MGLKTVQGPNCVQGPTWSLLKSSKLCWYQPKSLGNLLEFILFFFFFKRTNLVIQQIKLPSQNLPFKSFFSFPSSHPCGHLCSSTFPLHLFSHTFIYYFFYGLVSLQCFFLLNSSNSHHCLHLSSQFFFLQRLRMIFLG